MKKIFVLFAVFTALTVNTFAYSPSFVLTGEDVLLSPVFTVRISAKITKAEEDGTTVPEITDSDVPSEDVTSEDVTSEDVTSETIGSDSISSAESTDVPTELPAPAEDMTVTVTNSDTVTDTASDPESDTDTSADTQPSGIFGGEGTVVFDMAKIQIVSVSPCAPEGVTLQHGAAGSVYRFMFYSENAIEDDIPLFDIEFKILSKNKNVSVTVSEGLFSDGAADTPCESVSFTAVYTPPETLPPVTSQPSESETSAVTTSQEESSLNTEKNTSQAETTDAPPSEGVSTSPPDAPDVRDPSPLLTIIVVTAVVLIAAVTTAIIIVKKTRE